MTIIKNHLFSNLFIVVLFVFYGNNVQAATIIYPHQLLSENTITPSNDLSRANVFVTLSAKDFAIFTGRKLTLVQKLLFKAAQSRLKKDLKLNPDLLVTEYYDPIKKKFKFDSLWFILGIMIGPLAILFAWTSKRNKTSQKSAFLGFLIFILWFGFLFVF